MVSISKQDAEGVLSAIKKHEAARPDFSGDGYSEDEWSGITALIVALGGQREAAKRQAAKGASLASGSR